MGKHRLPRAPRQNPARTMLSATLVVCALGSTLPAHADPGREEVRVAAQGPAERNAPQRAEKPAGETDKADRDDKDKINVTAEEVLALARQQIGISENERGGGTKFQEWYAGSRRALETIARDGGKPSDYLNAPWCAMFVSWVGEQTGARPQVGWDAYTVTHAKWFRANNRWGTLAKPGAVVFFAWNGSKSIEAIQHVGFVVRDNHDGTITTIEGNTGNGKVEERVRPKSQVVGYGYPEYAG
jgi:hypothetical protein